VLQLIFAWLDVVTGNASGLPRFTGVASLPGADDVTPLPAPPGTANNTRSNTEGDRPIARSKFRFLEGLKYKVQLQVRIPACTTVESFSYC